MPRMKLRRLFHALVTPNAAPGAGTGRGTATGAGTDSALEEAQAGADPLALFDRWYNDAQETGLYLPEAMTLATATPDGVPSARMVLLKDYGPDGFVFFTNYDSRKAVELEANPRAALVLHWPTLHRQVRIDGDVVRTTRGESEAYFRTRARGSRLAAWASKQSAPLEHRGEIEERFREKEAEFEGSEDVPLPPFWGGYRLRPHTIEFWQGRANRVHDRLLFARTAEGWRVGRLSP
jgi:pyridoxamine 5'-phosphate oxidase